MSSETLPDVAVKPAINLIRDSRLAIVLGLIPILGLIYVLRLVQWYLCARRFPALVGRDETDLLSREFREALPRLWFAVLFWPVVFMAMTTYLTIERLQH